MLFGIKINYKLDAFFFSIFFKVPLTANKLYCNNKADPHHPKCEEALPPQQNISPTFRLTQ